MIVFLVSYNIYREHIFFNHNSFNTMMKILIFTDISRNISGYSDTKYQ